MGISVALAAFVDRGVLEHSLERCDTRDIPLIYATKLSVDALGALEYSSGLVWVGVEEIVHAFYGPHVPSVDVAILADREELIGAPVVDCHLKLLEGVKHMVGWRVVARANVLLAVLHRVAGAVILCRRK